MSMDDKEELIIESTSSSLSKLSTNEKTTVEELIDIQLKDSSSSTSTDEKASVSSNEQRPSSGNTQKKKSAKKADKDKQTMETLLGEFVDELEHQLIGMNLSARHYARKASRLEARVERRSKKLHDLITHVYGLRQKVWQMQRARLKHHLHVPAHLQANRLSASNGALSTLVTSGASNTAKSSSAAVAVANIVKAVVPSNNQNMVKVVMSNNSGANRNSYVSGSSSTATTALVSVTPTIVVTPVVTSSSTSCDKDKRTASGESGPVALSKGMERIPERVTLSQIKLRKMALEYLITKVTERLRTIKSSQIGQITPTNTNSALGQIANISPPGNTLGSDLKRAAIVLRAVGSKTDQSSRKLMIVAIPSNRNVLNRNNEMDNNNSNSSSNQNASNG